MSEDTNNAVYKLRSTICNWC